MRNTLLVGLLALAVPACLVGTGDITGSGNPSGGTPDPGGNPNPTPTPHVTGTVDKTTVSTELSTTETLTYTLTGDGGFTGDVTVTPSAVDAQGNPITTGITLTPSAPTVTLAQDGTGTVSVDVKIASDLTALSPTIKLALSSSTAAASEVDSAFTIKNQITISIDAGTGTGSPHTNLPLPNSRLMIHSGTKIIFHNADTISHEIHGDGGIPHEQGALNPNSDYTVTPTTDGDWYCHDHESSGQARIIAIE